MTKRQLFVFRRFLLLLAVGSYTFASKSPSIELSKELFEEVTAGKSVFIKFYAPWCGHCQQLAPAWERLGQNFQTEVDHPSLIGQVDCTKHERWCVQLGVTAYPTLRYGDPSYGGIFLEEYTSIAKSYEDLMAFAESKLRMPICSPGNIKACDPVTQTKLYEYWNMSQSELQAAISAQEEEIRQAEKGFQHKMKIFQEIYDNKAREYELTSSRLKRQIRLLKTLEALEEEPSAGI